MACKCGRQFVQSYLQSSPASDNLENPQTMLSRETLHKSASQQISTTGKRQMTA